MGGKLFQAPPPPSPVQRSEGKAQYCSSYQFRCLEAKGRENVDIYRLGFDQSVTSQLKEKHYLIIIILKIVIYGFMMDIDLDFQLACAYVFS